MSQCHRIAAAAANDVDGEVGCDNVTTATAVACDDGWPYWHDGAGGSG